MTQLTYADRELLLQTFDSLKDAWKGPDDELLSRASEWAKSIAPTYGFEHALTRDIAVLSRYLIDCKEDQYIADIARAGLLYVLTACERGLAQLHNFGLLDDAFVTSYAVHEIRERLGKPATYNPPRLTSAEQERAEELFLELLHQPLQEDEQLISEARRTVKPLSNLVASGLFRRLRRNIDFLSAVLMDDTRTAEHKSYARAALAYIICEQDAIDDRLGIIGYLDDNFIAQLAVDLIEPARAPWLELLDATVGVWPFLNSFFVNDGGGARLPSEFTIINCALSCTELREGSDVNSAIVVVPATGPLPLMLGLVAALGQIHSTGRRNYSEADFRDGQKVLVDYCAVAEFAGFGDCNGRKTFKLRQYRTERGQRLECVRDWPISHLGRLTPAGASRATRGSLPFKLSHTAIPLPGIAYLFGDHSISHLSSVDKYVVVVAPLAITHKFAQDFTINGWPLKDVVPMGQISNANESIQPWSNRFGSTPPLLLCASDVDTATAMVEESPDRCALFIVDATGRNAAKHASLRRLKRFNVPTLVITDERAVNDIDTTSSAIWEWTSDDFRALVWPPHGNGNASGVVSRHERRMQKQASATPIIDKVSLPAATEAYEALRRVQRLAKQRGKDQLADLEESISLSFLIVSQLLRSATPIDEKLPSFASLNRHFTKFRETYKRSLYLSNDERAALDAFYARGWDLFESLRTENPKALQMQALLAEAPRAAIICPDARLVADIEHHYPRHASRVLARSQADSDYPDGVIVPGWFRKSRMACLLTPQITHPLTLLLYDIETTWYDGFISERQDARLQRRRNSDRTVFFPQYNHWPSPALKTPPNVESAQRLQELDDTEENVFNIDKARIYRAHRSTNADDTVLARLVLFSGGSYGFFTDTYKLNVVTHLIEGTITEDNERIAILQMPADKLQVGDAVAFRQSSHDIIRDVADTILPPGARTLAATWKGALLRYASQHSLDVAGLHERLREAGCRVQQQTVEMWLRDDDIIAPQAYRRDVTAISTATGDAELKHSLDAVLDAISIVRSAHLKASGILAKQLCALAAEVVRQEQSDTVPVHLRDGFIIVRVAETSSDNIAIRIASANRLIEIDPWPE